MFRSYANSKFNIDWAVNASGTPVSLTGVDFIKIHTAMIQDAGWLGEVSTEIAGIETSTYLDMGAFFKVHVPGLPQSGLLISIAAQRGKLAPH